LFYFLREEVRRRETPVINWASRIPHPNKVEKALLFLLGKKTVGFLSQPLLPKGVDSLLEWEV
jgi:hypothetical protein